MAKIIAIAIKKGGSAKTTTAVNLAAGLAREGKKTLLIDLDNQADSTTYSGLLYTELPYTLVDYLRQRDQDITKCIEKTELGYDIVASHEDMEELELKTGQTHILKEIFSDIVDNYDYVIIDTNPVMGSGFTVAALVMADYVLIPMQVDQLGLDNLPKSMKAIQDIKKYHNETLKILGILPTMHDTRRVVSNKVLEDAQRAYKELLLPFTIKWSAAVSSGSYTRFPVILHDQKDAEYSGYPKLLEFILKEV